MSKKKYFLFFAYLLGPCLVAYAQTEHPVEDFLANKSPYVRNEAVLLMFRVDLNGDGTKEIFLSWEKARNSRLGNIWRVYISQGNKFHRYDKLISLPHSSLKAMPKEVSYPEKEGERLFYVTSGKKKRHLRVTEILISNNNIKKKPIANIKLLAWAERPDSMIPLLDDAYRDSVPVTKGKKKELKEQLEGEEGAVPNNSN